MSAAKIDDDSLGAVQAQCMDSIILLAVPALSALTLGFGIMGFNHKLRRMWTRAVEADLALRYLAEVAILIDPHPMRKGARGGRNDTGVVVVGGRLALKSSLNRATAVGLHTDSVGAGHAGPQPREFPSDFAEALQGRILRPGRKRGTVTSDDPRGQDQAEILSRDPLHFERDAHFSTGAIESGSVAC